MEVSAVSGREDFSQSVEKDLLFRFQIAFCHLGQVNLPLIQNSFEELYQLRFFENINKICSRKSLNMIHIIRCNRDAPTSIDVS